MGLFSKKPKPSAQRDPIDVILPGGDVVDVVGESHYQAALESLVGGRCEEGWNCERWAHLVLEPDNPWDRDAVAVVIEGQKVGYLGRDDASEYAHLLRQLMQKDNAGAVCLANIRGGWQRGHDDYGHFGVKLALARPEHLTGAIELDVFAPPISPPPPPPQPSHGPPPPPPPPPPRDGF